MSTWTLVTQQIKKLEKSVVENTRERISLALDETSPHRRQGETHINDNKLLKSNSGISKQ